MIRLSKMYIFTTFNIVRDINLQSNTYFYHGPMHSITS